MGEFFNRRSGRQIMPVEERIGEGVSNCMGQAKGSRSMRTANCLFHRVIPLEASKQRLHPQTMKREFDPKKPTQPS